jgi:lactate dehydrogenase-like 2-hydroxyacid dehydrogenase
MHAGGANAVGVAETTVMLMLAVCKNMFELATLARNRRWTAHHSTLGKRTAQAMCAVLCAVCCVVCCAVVNGRPLHWLT